MSDGYGTRAVQIRSRSSARTWVIEPGTEADLRRDPGAVVALESSKISRTAHARIIWEGETPVLVNDGDARGIYVNGTRQARVPITGRKLVRLGTATEGEDLEFTTVTATRPLRPPPGLPGRGGDPVGGDVGGIGAGAAAGAAAGAGAGAAAGGVGGRRQGRGGTRPLSGIGPGGGQADTAGLTQTPGGAPTGPSLTVTCASVTKTLAGNLGRTYQLGRASSADVPVPDDGVSREHLRLAWEGTGWVVTDVSSRGTFRAHGGQRLPASQAVSFTEPLALRLGSPTSGTHVTLTPAGTGSVAARLPRWLLPAAAAVVVGILVFGALVWTRAGNDNAAAGGLTTAELNAAKKAVVRLEGYQGGQAVFTGSGTIISSDGLILTNAHVADPPAVGQVAQYGYDKQFDGSKPNAFLMVGITTTPDKPVKDMYRAKLLISDGYVDLAVVKIYAKADGSALNGTLDLPTIPVGDSDTVKAGDPIDVLGFPGAADSDTVVVNPGAASAPVTDEHLHSDRAWFDSSATVRHGNSGGAAIDSRGELIGVPTRLSGDAEAGDGSDRIRPTKWAEPLIAKAKTGGDLNYVSPYLVAMPSSAQATYAGVSVGGYTCDQAKSGPLPSGASGYYINFSVKGVPDGADLFPVLLDGSSQDPAQAPVAYDEHSWVASSKDDGCVWYFVDTSLPDGSYIPALFGGPSGDQLLAQGANLVIGSAPQPSGTTTSPGTGSASYCTPGAAVSTWPGNQAIQLGGVTRASDQKVVVDGGKMIVVSLLGSSTGFDTVAAAEQAAQAAINDNLGPAPYPQVDAQRWVVVQDSSGRAWALLAEYRPDVVTGQDSSGNQSQIVNPARDYCFTPPTEYKVAAWYATWYEDQWFVYDSTTNQISGS